MEMTPDKVQAWLDRYIEAWRSYDRDEIKSLFSDDVSYKYHPWDEALVGSDAVADSWIGDQDEPGSWEASYRPLLVAGNKVFTTGTSSYSDGRVFWNLWEIEFDGEGRCVRFSEWFMLQPRS
ncbi:MAG: nuclear transport factor 2 family protein [Acidimicrobiia bacterium]|nr:nuclear transport factor 2 family protein [Acidimicrobiia bacterium]